MAYTNTIALPRNASCDWNEHLPRARKILKADPELECITFRIGAKVGTRTSLSYNREDPYVMGEGE